MKLRGLCLSALFAALTAVGAWIRVPVGIGIITLQFLFAALSGILLGAKYGALSQLLYLALGLCGLPVFGAGGGFGYALSPTFGYLAGLIPAAYLSGLLTRGTVTPLRTAAACGAALGAVYAAGLPYLAFVMGVLRGQPMAFGAVLVSGMLLYLPGDCLKILVCVLLAPRLCRMLRRNETK